MQRCARNNVARFDTCRRDASPKTCGCCVLVMPAFLLSHNASSSPQGRHELASSHSAHGIPRLRDESRRRDGRVNRQTREDDVRPLRGAAAPRPPRQQPPRLVPHRTHPPSPRDRVALGRPSHNNEAAFSSPALTPRPSPALPVASPAVHPQKNLGVHPSRVILYGCSVGTGPAAKLAMALQHDGTPAGGLVMQSPYTSIREAAAALVGFVAYILFERWDNMKYARQSQLPWLIIHGCARKMEPKTQTAAAPVLFALPRITRAIRLRLCRAPNSVFSLTRSLSLHEPPPGSNTPGPRTR